MRAFGRIASLLVAVSLIAGSFVCGTKVMADDANKTELAGEGQTSKAMYRLYNPNSGEHFYTSNRTERDDCVSRGWRDEGIGWYAPVGSGDPVFRLYNPNAGEHHYTLDPAERDMLKGAGWRYEGIGWNTADSNGIPVYREYNPNKFACNHNFTTDAAEHDHLVKLGWKNEGIAWYASRGGVQDLVKDAAVWLEDANALQGATQVVLVGGVGKTTADLGFFEKDSSGKWVKIFTADARIGKNGLKLDRREGDGTTPIGIFKPTVAFGIAADPGCPTGYTKVDSTYYWGGNPASSYFNRLFSTRDIKGDMSVHLKNSEHISEYTTAYQYCLDIGFNTEMKGEKGFAIFMHCYTNNNYTLGCVAIPKERMKELLQRLRPDCRIVIDYKNSIMDRACG